MNQLPILVHLKELRKRLTWVILSSIVGAAICYFFYDWILRALAHPLNSIHPLFGDSRFVAHTILEGFLVRFKISAICGVVLASPVALYQLLRFIMPGLTRREKKIVLMFLAFSFVLSVTAVYVVYALILPTSIAILTSASINPKQVYFLLDYDKNLTLILELIGFGIIFFQMPVVLELLMMFNWVSRRSLLKNWRYIIVAIFILAAIFSPPDIFSQSLMAIPMIIFYFAAIGIAKLFRFGEG